MCRKIPLLIRLGRGFVFPVVRLCDVSLDTCFAYRQALLPGFACYYTSDGGVFSLKFSIRGNGELCHSAVFLPRGTAHNFLNLRLLLRHAVDRATAINYFSAIYAYNFTVRETRLNYFKGCFVVWVVVSWS